MNKNTFLSVEETVIYAQLRHFPFNLIRTSWLTNQLYLVLLQSLQNVFPLVACSYIIFRVNNTVKVLLPDSEIIS